MPRTARLLTLRAAGAVALESGARRIAVAVVSQPGLGGHMRTQNLPKFQQLQTGKAVEEQFLRAASILTRRLPGQYIDQASSARLSGVSSGSVSRLRWI